MTRPKLSDWIALMALVVMWGSAFLFTKLALDSFSPSMIVVGRLIIGAVLLVGLIIVTKQRPPKVDRVWLYFIALAVMGNALPFTLITWGQQRIDSSLAGILMAVMPLIVIALARVFVPGERLTRGRVAGFILGFLGVLILLGPDVVIKSSSSSLELIAQLAVLGGAVCYSISVIIARLKPPVDPRVTAAMVTLIGAFLVTPPALNDHLIADSVSGIAILAVLVLGIFSTGLASIVYFRLITTAGPVFLSLINYLIPVWAMLAGTIFLSEALPTRFIAALALILAGIWISHRPRSRSKSVKPTAATLRDRAT